MTTASQMDHLNLPGTTKVQKIAVCIISLEQSFHFSCVCAHIDYVTSTAQAIKMRWLQCL